jgi:hypothetical protein
VEVEVERTSVVVAVLEDFWSLRIRTSLPRPPPPFRSAAAVWEVIVPEISVTAHK